MWLLIFFVTAGTIVGDLKDQSHLILHNPQKIFFCCLYRHTTYQLQINEKYTKEIINIIFKKILGLGSLLGSNPISGNNSWIACATFR